MKLRIFFCLAIALFQSVPGLAAVGKETQNGGSLVINGKTYELADLHLKRKFLSEKLFTLSGELEARLLLIEKHLRIDLGLNLTKKSGEDLFRTEIFGMDVEYRLTSELPSHCRFVTPPELNLEDHQLLNHAACTDANITYLVPEWFSQLSVSQAALLILHERLHAFSSTSLSAKMAFVKAVHILESVYFPALAAQNEAFAFRSEELEAVNELTVSLRHLTNHRGLNDRDTQLQWTNSGGILAFFDAPSSVNPQNFIITFGPIVIGLGSRISLNFSDENKIKPSFVEKTPIYGVIYAVQPLEIIRSSLHFESVFQFRSLGRTRIVDSNISQGQGAIFAHIIANSCELKNYRYVIPSITKTITIGRNDALDSTTEPCLIESQKDPGIFSFSSDGSHLSIFPAPKR